MNATESKKVWLLAPLRVPWGTSQKDHSFLCIPRPGFLILQSCVCLYLKLERLTRLYGAYLCKINISNKILWGYTSGTTCIETLIFQEKPLSNLYVHTCAILVIQASCTISTIDSKQSRKSSFFSSIAF